MLIGCVILVIYRLRDFSDRLYDIWLSCDRFFDSCNLLELNLLKRGDSDSSKCGKESAPGDSDSRNLYNPTPC